MSAPHVKRGNRMRECSLDGQVNLDSSHRKQWWVRDPFHTHEMQKNILCSLRYKIQAAHRWR